VAEPRLPSDAELADRLRAGDEAAFRLVLDAWSPAMTRLARSFVSTDDSAEEVVQEAWLGVLKGVGRFEGRAALKTWVFRIVVNIAKGRGIREAGTVPFSSLRSEDEVPVVDASALPEIAALPENALLHREAQRVVSEALASLPERHRVVVTLRDVEGYASEEVSRMLNLSPGNQRVILHRARAMIRARLEFYFA
jgi:RNA polymerase sigma-70 factor, ECF subfamily